MSDITFINIGTHLCSVLSSAFLSRPFSVLSKEIIAVNSSASVPVLSVHSYVFVNRNC